MMKTNKMGLYIHVPFCIRKCAYCDFLSFPCSDGKLLSEYTRALVEEIKLQAGDWTDNEFDSVFIGGGTPSLLSPEDIKLLMETLKAEFNISDEAEITIESNPATVDQAKLEMYLEQGINRLSIGVQSFDNQILKVLGRIHDKNDAFNAIRLASRLGFENINVDLMFAIPNQTSKAWADTVRQAIFLNVPHISLYSLQIEEGTPFYKAIKEDKTLEETPEQIDRQMYKTALNMLKVAGYNQYEISNSAKPGFESRHNLKYWSYNEYLGLGLGASSFANGKRYKNHSSMAQYLKAIKQGKAPIDPESYEHYTVRDEMGIFVFTGLRKNDGIDTREFQRIFNVDFFDVYDPELINKYKGFLEFSDSKVYLTDSGRNISNIIMADFV